MRPRSDKVDFSVDFCEINCLGSSLIDFCISTGKRSWLSPRRAPLFKSRFGVKKAKEAFIMQNQLAMTRVIYFTKVNLVRPLLYVQYLPRSS